MSEILLPLILLAIALGIYLIPWHVARYRNHPSKFGILVLNFFLGWTFVGWVVSLAWAFSGTANKKESN
jgi:RsiW-degrading membrane proteinase PrsW (M82 family)